MIDRQILIKSLEEVYGEDLMGPYKALETLRTTRFEKYFKDIHISDPRVSHELRALRLIINSNREFNLGLLVAALRIVEENSMPVLGSFQNQDVLNMYEEISKEI